jgi:hypothetical protein
MDQWFHALVDKHGLFAAMRIVEDSFTKADQESQELFGDRQFVSAEELAIAWNDNLSHEEKLKELTMLRTGEEIDEQPVSPGDAIRARSLGVRL